MKKNFDGYICSLCGLWVSAGLSHMCSVNALPNRHIVNILEAQLKIMRAALEEISNLLPKILGSSDE